MLAKLAAGNIRRNFRTYWSFFFSAAFGVFVLYLFLSIVFGKATAGAAAFQSTQVIFGIGAALTAVFTAFFIWYSNSFFIKSRKKEFATYMLLGMSKKQTMVLAFFENLTILTLAYALGIAMGMLFNKLLIMLLFYTMQVSVDVPFEFCIPALKLTSAIYLGVFLLIVLHSIILLNKTSLIALINASKRAERGMRVSWRTWVVGALALAFMGLGYYLALALGRNIVTWPAIVLFVCIGTALLFLGLATLFFHMMRKNETGLYRGTRLVTVSQLMHRYRGNVGALTVIAITTSVALCAVLCCCGLSANVHAEARSMRPFSVEYLDTGEASSAILNGTLKAHPEVKEKGRVSFTLVKVYEYGTQSEKRHPFFTLIGESQYNEIMRLQGRREISLAGPEKCLLVKRSNITNYNEPILTQAEIIKGGGKLTLEIQKFEQQQPFCSDTRNTGRILVVSDGVLERVRTGGDGEAKQYVGLMLNDEMSAESFSPDLGAHMPKETALITYYKHYSDGLEIYGVLMFVGVFVGLLFVVATGGILYFRMAMEAAEDRERFVTLARIGMSAKEIRAAVAKGLAIIFGAPLVVAAANTLVAMTILERMVNFSMLGAYLVILAAYAGLYALYYLLTLSKYVKTVADRTV